MLDCYYADTEACTRAVRDRFDSGHKAKIERVDERRRAEAAEARIKALEEALREMKRCTCPEVFGEDPDCVIHGYDALKNRIEIMTAALERQRANIEHWLESGKAASPEESKSIYDQICAALEGSNSQ